MRSAGKGQKQRQWFISRSIWISLLAFLALTPRTARSQISGYTKHLHAVIVMPACPEWLLSSMVHNRIDATWHAASGMQMTLGLRNRLIYGDLVSLIPHYAETLEEDPGYWRWSRVIADGSSWVVHSMIDRGYIDYTHQNWQLRLGRQRINWGMNLVWNPNDLFNSFSYIDFDYEERSGRDAVQVTCYTGAVSFLQAVYQPAEDANEAVLAMLYRMNRWGYDLQVLGGRWARDWVVGAGWSGQAGGGAVRGEWTWFHPRDTGMFRTTWIASLSADYTLRNGLYGQISLLYNSAGKTGAAGAIDFLGEMYLTAKTLTRSRLNGFVQLRYPLTPLVTVDTAIIHNPCDHSCYVAPSLSVSLGDNLDFLLIGQFLSGDPGSEFGGDAKVGYTRLKWSF